MSVLPPQLYAQWRARCRAVPGLRDAPAPDPAERLLQQVWLHQRLRRDRLITLDGRRVTVLHPGFWNREAGPDFRRAVIQLGDEAPRSGDVEVDLQPGAWRAHGHEHNPAYVGVILHVVWEAPTGVPVGPPVLPLRPCLDASLEELEDWADSGVRLPASAVGECAAPFCRLPPPQREAVLQQAALVRFRRKADELGARAREAGWEQSLWEGLFSALGYKRNVWPMRRLAELIPRVIPAGPAPSPTLVEARLLGVAGLLPVELVRLSPRGGQHARKLWDLWWREQEAFADVRFPCSVWNRGGLRPANQPQRRLALAARWLTRPDLIARLESWFRDDLPGSQLGKALHDILDPGPDLFWCRHWTLRSRAFSPARPLLGTPRTTDLAVNVILPWFHIRARKGGSEALQLRAERRYLEWPKAEDNALLRLARQRVLGGGAGRALPGAAGQQGLLQIVRDFCDHANALCEHCRFPDLIRAIRGAGD